MTPKKLLLFISPTILYFQSNFYVLKLKSLKPFRLDLSTKSQSNIGPTAPSLRRKEGGLETLPIGVGEKTFLMHNHFSSIFVLQEPMWH